MPGRESSADIRFRLVEDYETSKIVDVLNRVTEKLLAKGINQWDYPWDYKEIKDEIEKGNQFILEDSGGIVGTFSIKEVQQWDSLDIKEKFLYLYRIAILPEQQGKSYGLNVVDFSRQYATQKDLPLYLDCWAGSTKLKEFYSGAGMEYLGDFPEEDYMISIFKDLKA